MTLSDIDMRARTINIDHQLQRTANMKFVIVNTKSTSGTRMFPMSGEVYDCFKFTLSKRKSAK